MGLKKSKAFLWSSTKIAKVGLGYGHCFEIHMTTLEGGLNKPNVMLQISNFVLVNQCISSYLAISS